MSDAVTAASAYTLDTSKTVSQPAFTIGAALRTPGKAGEEAAGQDAGQETGDTVILSEQGKAMAARQAQTQESSSDDDQEAAHIRQIKERIAKLQQEIEKLQQDQTLSEDEKRKQIMSKQGELAEMETQLQQAYEEQAKAASAAGKSGGMTSLGSYGAKG